MVEGSSSWTIAAGELPVAIYGLRAVSVNNRVLITGNQHCNEAIISYNYYSNITGGLHFESVSYQDDVLEFRKEDQSWTRIGKMSVGRSSHGVSVVNAADVAEYCTKTIIPVSDGGRHSVPPPSQNSSYVRSDFFDDLF